MKEIKIIIEGDVASGKSYFAQFVVNEFPKHSKDQIEIVSNLDDKNRNILTIRRK